VSAFPKRPGYRATAVDYRDGKPRVTRWEKIGAADPEPAPAPPPPMTRRGALAAERPIERDLFSPD
jgi:hypothetical protein